MRGPSQQSLSEHIKKLEEQYNTKLFTRSPHLALTDSGRALLDALHQIQVIENSLAETINDSSNLQHGKILIGCNHSRATLMIPDIYPRFHEQYPNVKLELTTGQTKKLEPLLESGKLDFFIGINLSRSKNLNYTLLMSEKIFLIASDNILKKLEFTSAQVEDFKKNGIYLEQFRKIPFILNSSQETLRTFFDDLTIAYANQFDIPQELDHPLSRASLCAKDFCVTIMPGSMLPFAWLVNQKSADNKLRAFPLRNNTIYMYNSYIAYHRNMNLSPYKKCFMDLVIDYYHHQLDPQIDR